MNDKEERRKNEVPEDGEETPSAVVPRSYDSNSIRKQKFEDHLKIEFQSKSVTVY